MSSDEEGSEVESRGYAGIRDGDRVRGLWEASECHQHKRINNRIDGNVVKHGDMMNKDEIVELLSVEVLGMVPADEHTITAANRGIPVVHDKKAPSGSAFLRIAARIDGDEVPFLDLEPRISIMARVKGLVGLNGRAYSHA